MLQGKPQKVTLADRWYKVDRLGGLRRFALAITVLNVLGHSWFGFEQSWAQPLIGLAAAYGMELLLEFHDCWLQKRRPRFLAGGKQQFVDFFLPAHISGLACAMLLYSNDRLAPIAFAAAAAIASKHVFRLATENGSRHFYNPSNFGITLTLLLFPWVGIAPPYHFTENLTGWGDWLVPGIIIVSGTLLNTRFTRRLPLIAAWLSGFVLQAGLRNLIFGTPLTAALLPMTGVAYLLYTFYMVTDPPTTPGNTRGQILFGFSVATTYGLLMVAHVVFGLFFALTIVCSVRGLYLYVHSLVADRSGHQSAAEAIAPTAIAAASSPARSLAEPHFPARAKSAEPVVSGRLES